MCIIGTWYYETMLKRIMFHKYKEWDKKCILQNNKSWASEAQSLHKTSWIAFQTKLQILILPRIKNNWLQLMFIVEKKTKWETIDHLFNSKFVSNF